MLTKLNSIIAGLIILFVFSCTKTTAPSGSAALNIVNATIGSTALVTNFNAYNGKTIDTLQYYNTALQVYYGSSAEIGSYTGSTPLSLSDITDTTRNVYSNTLNLPVGSIHTLFMTGTLTSPDNLFTTDVIPYYPASGDSVTGVRFVNLSPGSNPISVTLQSDTTHTAIGSPIAYKSISNFQSFSANTNAENNGYTFEFRDAASDSVLATYSLNIYLFKSQTLAFYGNTTSGFSVMSINNY